MIWTQADGPFTLARGSSALQRVVASCEGPHGLAAGQPLAPAESGSSCRLCGPTSTSTKGKSPKKLLPPALRQTAGHHHQARRVAPS